MYEVKFPKFRTDGKYKTNPYYSEIIRLHELLTEAKIPHDFHSMFDGWQVVYPCEGAGRIADAVEFGGSYGDSEDLLELMGLLEPEEYESNSVVGHLTAEEVFERFKKDFDKREDENNG